MPDQQDNTNPTPIIDPASPVTGQDNTFAAVSPDVVVQPTPEAPPAPTANPTPATTQDPVGSLAPDFATNNVPENNTDNSAIIADVAARISGAHSILIALSSDPSVDEIAAAIGLALYLDRVGKRVTAIYSGATPNVLKFLKPEDTFEKSADILQDFVIALNKEKADHLRYKLDGEYVKIFITPYRSRITSDDLEFSYGDFNVDLVIALDVANGIDLDDALREHGRIMHDAVVINITTGNPGKLGEIEWSDKTSSSVSEMITELVIGMNSEKPEKEEATAFLTGIVAATNRFASAGTTSKTMKIASRLMDFGANQQLIAKNITSDTENEFFTFDSATGEKTDSDSTKLDIQHGNEKDVDETKEVEASVNNKESTLLADLKAAEADLATAGAETTPEENKEPVRIEDDVDGKEADDELASAAAEIKSAMEQETISTPESEPATISQTESSPEETSPSEEPSVSPEPTAAILGPSPTIPAPSSTASIAAEPTEEETNKYGQMLEEALAEAGGEEAPIGAIISPAEEPAPAINNPALNSAPEVATAPEINGVPEINYMPPAGEDILPPPPTPPVDLNSLEPTSLGPQPAMQDQIYRPQVASPDSFQIPGA